MQQTPPGRLFRIARPLRDADTAIPVPHLLLGDLRISHEGRTALSGVNDRARVSRRRTLIRMGWMSRQQMRNPVVDDLTMIRAVDAEDGSSGAPYSWLHPATHHPTPRRFHSNRQSVDAPNPAFIRDCSHVPPCSYAALPSSGGDLHRVGRPASSDDIDATRTLLGAYCELASLPRSAS